MFILWENHLHGLVLVRVKGRVGYPERSGPLQEGKLIEIKFIL